MARVRKSGIPDFAELGHQNVQVDPVHHRHEDDERRREGGAFEQDGWKARHAEDSSTAELPPDVRWSRMGDPFPARKSSHRIARLIERVAPGEDTVVGYL